MLAADSGDDLLYWRCATRSDVQGRMIGDAALIELTSPKYKVTSIGRKKIHYG